MNKTQFAAALAVGAILGLGGSSLSEAAIKDGVDLNAVEISGVNMQFLTDGGCLASVNSTYHAAQSDLAPQAQVQQRPYDGQRCLDIKAFAAKAAALDYAKDNGKP